MGKKINIKKKKKSRQRAELLPPTPKSPAASERQMEIVEKFKLSMEGGDMTSKSS